MNIEPKKEEEKIGGYTPQDFAQLYQDLVKKTGYQIVHQPVWVATNHGSFEMIIQATIGQLPKETKEQI